MFWFWDRYGKYSLEEIDKKLLTLRKIKRNDSSIDKVLNVYQKFVSDDPISAKFIGLILADHSVVRRPPIIDYDMSKYSIIKHKLTLTNIMIAPLVFKNIIPKKNYFYFQLSGSRSPFIPIKYNVLYLMGVLKLIRVLSKRFKDSQFLVCGNPEVLEEAGIKTGKLNWQNKSHPNVTVIGSVSQEDNYRYMLNSRAIFIPAGLESIYEGIYFKVPLALLPAQNIGQDPIAMLFSELGFNLIRCTTRDIYPNCPDITDETGEATLYYYHDKLFNEDFDKFVPRYAKFIENMFDDKKRELYIQKNSGALLETVMGKPAFSEGTTVAKPFIDIIKKITKFYGETSYAVSYSRWLKKINNSQAYQMMYPAVCDFNEGRNITKCSL